MLGVLKRRLKPKRPSEKENNHNSRKNAHAKSEPIVPVDMARITSSQRQIHPLLEEKAQLLAYDDNVSGNKPTPTPSVKRSPDDPFPKNSAAVPELVPPPSIHPSAPGSPSAIYHPAPNICVEGGRIEFIKSPSEGSRLHASADSQDNNPDKKTSQTGAPYQSGEQNRRKSVAATTRAQQTQADIGDFVEADEKCDIAKEFLEARIKELERLLEAEQKSGQRERLAVARLQRQLARREVIHRDVDRERRLRADTESRLRETVVESERYRTTLAGLQREFSRMEDTVRTMLQYKSRCEVLNQEKASLAAAYESRVQQYQNTISKLNQENESLRHQIRLLETTGTAEIQSTLLERLRSLESENAHITRDADFQRKQYEKCLDDIANQVVRALLSQKGLREEIGNLQRRIKELENQNHALANILVRKFENGESGLSTGKNALINKSWFPGTYGERIRCEGSTVSSVTSSSILPDLEDKSVLKNVLQTPLRSLETLLLPLQRPRSLNLFLHASRIPATSINNIFSGQCQHKKNKLNPVHLSKKTTEDEGNESPESGNKDEGYSTMSSDVQCPGDANELSKRELEDLKEASDETEVVKLDANNSFASVVLMEDVSDPDIFFIPLNFTLTINPRHSYPPTKDFLPFQHIMKSFSDSHLCLKLDPNAPLLTSPISPSMLFVDLIEKNHPLRRSKATNSLLSKEEEILQELEETQSSAGSWCSGTAEGCWWDTEYIQHCLKLDDVRLKSFHPQKEFFHLDYDNTELEDWSLSLSCEDISKYADTEFRKGDASSPGMLPSIQECNGYELESDSNSKTTGKLNYLTVDTRELEPVVWPYKEKESFEITSWNSAQSMESPGGSWSSVTSNNSDYSCHSLNEGYHHECSKRCSTASDDAESSAVGTDFTRDFYRLVKFESTKSLASNSSRSLTNGDVNVKENFGQSNVRESALKNVLNFIAEQQQYCHEREEEDTILQSYSKSPEKPEEASGFKKECHSDQTKPDGNVYGGDEQCTVQSQSKQSGATCESECSSSENNCRNVELAEEGKSHRNYIAPTMQQAVKWGADEESPEMIDNSANRTEIYNKCSSLSHYEVHDNVSNYSAASSHLMTINEEGNENGESVYREEPREEDRSPRRQESLIPVLRPTQDATAAKIPQRRKIQQSSAKVWGTKIPVISTRRSESSSMPKITERKTISHRETNIPVPTARKGEAQKPSSRKAKTSPEVSKAVMSEDGSFHERATSKDVIDELNRMIRKGEEIIPGNSDGDLKPLDIACCCPTGWVHVESDIDFTDPKARANLLDVMLASSGSSGGSGSSSDSGGDDPVDYSHLHRLHRFRRQRKASATRKQLGVLRYPLTSVRPSIIGRENFFFRYGDKEREAISSFDFLEDFSTTSASGCSSTDTLGWSQAKYRNSSPHTEPELPSPEADIVTIETPTTPATPSDDSDERTGGPVSLSDSCADSYTESTESVEDQC